MSAVRSSFLALLLGTLVPAFAFAWSTDPAVNTPVAAVTGDQVHVVAIANSDGSTIVAWEDARGANRDIYAQKLDPSGIALWGPNGLAVCTAAGDQLEPRLASDGSGGCIVAWIDRRSGGADLYAQRVSSAGSGTWNANGLVLCNAATDQRELDVSADGAGGIFATWIDPRDGKSIAYAQHLNANGLATWTANGLVIDGSRKDSAEPSVFADGSGGLVVGFLNNGQEICCDRLAPDGAPIWAQNKPFHIVGAVAYAADGSGGIYCAWSDSHLAPDPGDVFAQHRSGTNGAELWIGSGVPVCVQPNAQTAPRLLVDAGDLVVTWQDARTDAGDVYAQRLNAAGVAQWAANGAPVVAAAGAQERPSICVNGIGGYFVAWSALAAGDRNLYARELDGSGNALGGTFGDVCFATGVQDSLTIVATGPEGAAVFWEDGRTPANGKDVYAQRIGPLGLVAPYPAVTGLVPQVGPPGTLVSIRGSHLSGTTGVTFGGVAAAFSVVSDSELTATAPSCGRVSVVAPVGLATSLDFFESTPSVASISPSSATIGTSVRIRGACFPGATGVSFNGTPTSTFTVLSDSEIVATIPGAATSGPVTVTTGAGSGTSPGVFSLLPEMGELPGCFFVPPFPAYSTGTAPRGIAIADFNNDGLPDFAVPNAGSASVSVYLGNGDGTFGARTDFPAGPHPASIAVGDFNVDSHPDLVVANQGSNNVRVLFGQAGGSFGSPLVLTVSNQARSVAVGDVDDDGKLDIAVGPMAGGIFLIKGDGAGGFGPAQMTNANSNNTVEILIADVDRIGRLDLVTVDSTAQTRVYTPTNGTNYAGMGFNANLDDSHGVAIVDLDLDGRPDLVAVGTISLSNQPRLSFCHGNASNRLDSGILTAMPTGADPRDVATADLNQDGRPDILVSSAADSTLYVYMGNGTTTFGSPLRYQSPGMQPADLRVGDPDGDSRADILVVNRAAGQVNTLRNSGANDLFCPPYAASTGLGRDRALALADFNGDGRTDVAATDTTSNAVTVWLGTSSGELGAPTNYASGLQPGARFMVPGDFNEDGKLDLAITGKDNHLSVFIGNGAGGFPTLQQINTNSHGGVAVGDLNGDHHLDLVIGDAPNHLSVDVVLGNGTGVPNNDAVYPAGTNPVYPALGDLDGDGDLDLAVVGENVAGVNALLNNGSGVFGAPQFIATGSAPSAVTLSDIDGDGRADVLVTNRDSQTLSLLRSLGGGSFAPVQNYATRATPLAVAVGDVNGDGWKDVLVTNASSGSVSLWINQRDGTLGVRNDYDGLTAPYQIAVGDMNTDGKLDLVISSFGVSTITTLRNQGDVRAGSWDGGGIAIGAGGGHKQLPVNAPDGSGGQFIAWRELRGNGSFDAYLQRVTASGVVAPNWSPGGTVLSNLANNQYPTGIARDLTTGVFVVWADSRDSLSGSMTSLDIYAQRVNKDGGKMWTATGVPICRATGVQRNPIVVGDGFGGAIVQWIDMRSGSPELYVQRVDSTGVILWTNDGIQIGGSGIQKDQATMVSDHLGGAHVGWVQGTGNGRDVRAQHVDGSGQQTWGSTGVGVSTASGPQSDPVIVSDDLGGVELAWTDARGANADVYGQRLDPGGNPLWAPDGKPLVSTTGDQAAPSAVADDEHGMVLGWTDGRGGDQDVYDLRVDGNGDAAPGWPANGLQLVAQPGDQSHPTVVGDGESGAIVVWQDHRGANLDLYAQRTLSFGSIAPGWETNGTAVCTVVGDQLAQQVVSDGGGGALAAWQDERGDSSAIYAARVDGEGSNQPVGVVPDRPALAHARIAGLWPNPSRGELSLALDLPRALPVSITITSVAGRRIRALAGGELKAAGRQVFRWDGRDEHGVRVASGVYFVSCRCGLEHLRQRLVLLH